MAGKLAGRIALITGAAEGIGAAAARRFAAEGATVVVSDVNLEGARDLAESLGPPAFALPLDVCREDAWRAALAEIQRTCGRLDVLVNNAGGSGSGSIEELDYERYRAAMQLNVDSVFLGCKLAIELMKAHGGSIVNVSSIHGIRAASYAVAYSAAKGAVRLLTKAVALHCAERGYRIRCNSIHPGYILTRQMREWVESSEDPEATMAALLAKHPIGFLGDPEDVAAGILFLASDDARFMTGAELVVDGGFSLV